MQRPAAELVRELLQALEQRRRPRHSVPLHWLSWASLLVIAAGVALLAWFAAWKLPAQWIVMRWQADLLLVDNMTAQQRAAYLPALGKPGLRMLVRMLADPRADVRRTAADVLVAQVDQWKRLPLAEASEHVAAVTEELSRVATALPADQYEPIERLVIDLLHWPLDRESVDCAAVIGHCERTLAAMERARLRADANRFTTDQRLTKEGVTDPSASSDPTRLIEQPPSSDQKGVARLGGVAGGAGSQQPASDQHRAGNPSPPAPVLSSGEVERPEFRGVRRSLSDDDSSDPLLAKHQFPGGNPSLVTAPGARSGADRGSWPSNEDSGLDAASLAPEPGLGPRLVPLTPRQAIPLSPRAAESVATPESKLVPVTQLTDWHLAQQLNAHDAPRALAAAEELRRRGFSGRAIAVLEMLVDDDPQVRLDALAELANVSHLRPIPWLYHMLHDPDASVRRRVVAMLGTAPAPETVWHLNQLRNRETDRQVLDVLEHILAGR